MFVTDDPHTSFNSRVADQDPAFNFDTDPDPAFPFDTDPDPLFDTDPDPTV
jgi:hypothetical protein